MHVYIKSEVCNYQGTNLKRAFDFLNWSLHQGANVNLNAFNYTVAKLLFYLFSLVIRINPKKGTNPKIEKIFLDWLYAPKIKIAVWYPDPAKALPKEQR